MRAHEFRIHTLRDPVAGDRWKWACSCGAQGARRRDVHEARWGGALHAAVMGSGKICP